jgi:tetratricopeptide (TPR) repeat protein
VLSYATRFFGNVVDRLLTIVGRIASALASNRSLALAALAACVVLITGPWLRPPISRDFRALHIPIGEISSVSFVPEHVVETPRRLRYDSVAVPLLLVTAIAAVVVLVRPRRMSAAFGLLFALSIPALAITFWNYPTLIDSFNSEMRDRALLRAVFRQHSEHMLSAGTPDRLAVLGDKATRDDLLMIREHPLLVPLKYSVYGPWLVGLALAATIVSFRGSWSRRFRYAGVWAAVGILLAVAATWPRLTAEYYFAQASNFENANDFEQAEHALESARSTLPCLENTWQYWLAKGRLRVRNNQRDDRFAVFYLAHQALLSGDFTRARALLEPYVRGPSAAGVERDLFAGIEAQAAAIYVSDAKYSAAEICWSDAVDIAPWKVSYQLARGAARIAAAPQRTDAIDQEAMPLLKHVGDLMVASDYYALVGDAHFITGQFGKAREMYGHAMDLFEMPKYINVQAQEGRLGM